ncbi:MAG TPA: hypothetical protein OIM45_02035 [Clostridiaceae bacterium]|nr:hypothetical protein [Clostridiaceae bacterium]
MNKLMEYVKRIEDALGKKIEDAEIVSESNNIVIKFACDGKVYYAKFYKNKGTHVDNEIMLYSCLPKEGKKYLKVLNYSNFGLNEDEKFAIFEEVKGRTLAEIAGQEGISDEVAEKVASSMLEYFSMISQVKTKKYGNLAGSLEGSYDEFLKYIYEYQFPTTETLFLNLKTRKFASLPYLLLEKNAELLDENYSCLTPIDSNFNNIMIDENGDVKIIDPGAVISAPLSMGIGEFVAHSYGTKVYDKFIEKTKPSSEEIKRYSIYGILSSMNIMAFLVRNNIGEITKSKPFGNSNTFFELINKHLNVISSCENINKGKEPEDIEK